MSADSRLPEAKRRKYRGVGECILRVARQEGVAALWQGSLPTVRILQPLLLPREGSKDW